MIVPNLDTKEVQINVMVYSVMAVVRKITQDLIAQTKTIEVKINVQIVTVIIQPHTPDAAFSKIN